jgi:hypothetical protein
MLFESLVTENNSAFTLKVKQICNDLGIDPDWLMLCMYIESRINHRARNSTSGATGLIQFMPSTALGLGTTTEQLSAMTNVQQLDFVLRYLKPYQWKMKGFVDVYFAIFFPVAIGKPKDYILKTSSLSASKIASQNPGYDLNHDQQLTVAEVESKILSFAPPGDLARIQKKNLIPLNSEMKTIITILTIALAGAALFTLYTILKK